MGGETVFPEVLMTQKPFAVCVVCQGATDIESANAMCKTSVAYRKILADYPASEWERRWVRTYCEQPSKGSGLWTVEFEVCRKAGDK